MRMDGLLAWLAGHLRLLGLIAIVICVATWAVDLMDLVHKCPYCRLQRMAIGGMGVLMLLPDPRLWWVRYLGVVVAFLGAATASAQLFLVFTNLTGGYPSNPINLVMATGALFALVGQAMLLFTDAPDKKMEKNDAG